VNGVVQIRQHFRPVNMTEWRRNLLSN